MVIFDDGKNRNQNLTADEFVVNDAADETQGNRVKECVTKG
jgi:hypothetical protein